MNELHDRFEKAFRATGYVTSGQASELAEIAVKVANRSRHVSMTVKVDTAGMHDAMLDAVRNGLAPLIGAKHADAVVGRGPAPTPEGEAAMGEYLDELMKFKPRAAEGFGLGQPPGLVLAVGAELDNYGVKQQLPRRDDEPDNDYRKRLVEAYSQYVWSDHAAGQYFDKLRTFSREEWLEQYTQQPYPEIPEAERRSMAPRVCNLSGARHTWKEIGDNRLRCSCGYIVCGPYDKLPDSLKNAPPREWIVHHGGPCPVRHEEVEVLVRCQFGNNDTPKRCWPEAVNWHWGRPGSATTPNDVLKWRHVD